MKVNVFGWNVSPEDGRVLGNLINATIPDPEISVVDLSLTTKFTLEAGPILAFGQRAFNIVSAMKVVEGLSVLQLDPISKLYSKPENGETRRRTFKKLQQVGKETYLEEEDIFLTDKDIEKFLTKQLAALQKTLKATKKKFWKGTTASGRSIALVLKPTTKVTDCEIVLTFEELFAAKFAVEVMGVDSLTMIGDK